MKIKREFLKLKKNIYSKIIKNDDLDKYLNELQDYFSKLFLNVVGKLYSVYVKDTNRWNIYLVTKEYKLLIFYVKRHTKQLYFHIGNDIKKINIENKYFS